MLSEDLEDDPVDAVPHPEEAHPEGATEEDEEFDPLFDDGPDPLTEDTGLSDSAIDDAYADSLLQPEPNTGPKNKSPLKGWPRPIPPNIIQPKPGRARAIDPNECIPTRPSKRQKLDHPAFNRKKQPEAYLGTTLLTATKNGLGTVRRAEGSGVFVGTVEPLDRIMRQPVASTSYQAMPPPPDPAKERSSGRSTTELTITVDPDELSDFEEDHNDASVPASNFEEPPCRCFRLYSSTTSEQKGSVVSVRSSIAHLVPTLS